MDRLLPTLNEIKYAIRVFFITLLTSTHCLAQYYDKIEKNGRHILQTGHIMCATTQLNHQSDGKN